MFPRTALFLLLAFASIAGAAEHRSSMQRAHFMKAHPCPGGPDKGSTKHCRGFVVDHVVPLCAGGPDRPANMQWQTIAAGKAKDRVERRECRKPKA
jgi:hypothetical protein